MAPSSASLQPMMVGQVYTCGCGCRVQVLAPCTCAQTQALTCICGMAMRLAQTSETVTGGCCPA
jgi:hypothetical protein